MLLRKILREGCKKSNLAEEETEQTIDRKSVAQFVVYGRKILSDVWLTVHRNSVWIRKTN